jgi:hypothetical protein
MDACTYVCAYVFIYVYCYNPLRRPRKMRRYSESLRVGWSRDRIVVGARISVPSTPIMMPTQTPVQWVPGFYRWLSHRSIVLTTAFRCQGCEWVELYFYLPAGPAQAYRGGAFTLTLHSEVPPETSAKKQVNATTCLGNDKQSGDTSNQPVTKYHC